jgi:hypothetical protein
MKALNDQQTTAKARIRQLDTEAVDNLNPDEVAEEFRLRFLNFGSWPRDKQKAVLVKNVESIVMDGNGNATFTIKMGLTVDQERKRYIKSQYAVSGVSPSDELKRTTLEKYMESTPKTPTRSSRRSNP